MTLTDLLGEYRAACTIYALSNGIAARHALDKIQELQQKIIALVPAAQPAPQGRNKSKWPIVTRNYPNQRT